MAPRASGNAEIPPADLPRVGNADSLRVGTANLCFMRLLEKLATRFNRANVPLMALKGAALNLTVHQRPAGASPCASTCMSARSARCGGPGGSLALPVG